MQRHRQSSISGSGSETKTLPAYPVDALTHQAQEQDNGTPDILDQSERIQNYGSMRTIVQKNVCLVTTLIQIIWKGTGRT